MTDHIEKLEVLTKLFKLIEGRSSQNPIGFNELRKKSGLTAIKLNNALHGLYVSKAINKAEVTRQDEESKQLVKQLMVWPTGVVNKHNFASFTITQTATPSKKTKPVPVPRRNETKSASKPDAPVLGENVNQKPTDPSEAEKPRTLRMLEYIEAHPNCLNKDFATHFAFKNPLSYIRKHIEDGNVITTQVSGAKKSRYSLAEGMTAEDIYTRKATVNSQKETVKSEPVEPIQTEKQQTDYLLSLQGLTADDDRYIHAEFLTAYTSSGKLLIQGAEAGNLTLNATETEQLITFISKINGGHHAA